MAVIGILEHLERSAMGGWLLRFSANNLFWEQVKDQIKALPHEHRFWNNRALGGRGAWWVSDEGLAQIASLFANYEEMRRRADQRESSSHHEESHSYHRSYSGSYGSSAPTSRAQAFATLYLLPNAPKEVALAVHRALAKMHHPDLGGDLEKMKQINKAWEVVEASFPKENR